MRQLFTHISSIIRVWFRTPVQHTGVHLATLALGVLTLSLLINFVNQVLQSAELEARRTALATEVAVLEAENAQLLAAVEYAESDVHVERVAREQLGYARVDDMVLLPQFLPATPTPTPEPEPAGEAITPSDIPNWQGWWQAFVPDGHTSLIDGD